MSAPSVAVALAWSRIGTALLCLSVIWIDPARVAPWPGTTAFVAAAAIYGLAAVGDFFVDSRKLRHARSIARAMFGLDCLFLATMVAHGETGALALPLAALLLRRQAAYQGARAAHGMLALIVATFGAASLASAFWSAHPILIFAVAAMLLTIGLAPPTSMEEAAEAPQEARAAALQNAATQAQRSMQPRVETSPRRVLIVDPVTTSRLVLQKIIGRAGHIALGASSAAKATEMLGAGPTPFDVLVIGELPDMTGVAFAKSYRSSEHRAPPLHIIGLDATHSPTLTAAYIDAGADASLAKPVDFTALLDLIAAAPASAQTAELASAAPVAPAEVSFAEPVAPAAPRDHTGAEADGEPASAGPAIDLRALRDLESLGGADFVREIVNQFIVDGAGALRNLTRLTVDRDVEMFRDQAHALRSSAANVGARCIYETCLAWRAIAPEQLARDGAMHMRTLNRQFQEATSMLEAYIAQLGDGGAEDAALPSSGSPKIPDAA
jgi:CheY-like chemotaxis protein/HPt (histidine-containing phosphotransfer) domain-containing protein